MIAFNVLKKMKNGKRLYFTKELRQFYKEQAWNLNTVNGELKTPQNAESWFIERAIAEGLSYSARFIEYRSDVGDGPGARVEIQIGTMKTINLYSHKHLCLLKPKGR